MHPKKPEWIPSIINVKRGQRHVNIKFWKTIKERILKGKIEKSYVRHKGASIRLSADQ